MTSHSFSLIILCNDNNFIREETAMSFKFLNQLPTPAEIKEKYPLSEELVKLKKERDAIISDVIFCLRLRQQTYKNPG